MYGSWVLWSSVAAILGPAEALSRRLIFGAASLGWVSGGIAAVLGVSRLVEVLAFTTAFGAGLCVRRPLLRPYHRAVIRAHRMAGIATVTEPVDGGTGQVRYGGLVYAARSVGKTMPAGTHVNVFDLADDVIWVYPRHPVGEGPKEPDLEPRNAGPAPRHPVSSAPCARACWWLA